MNACARHGDYISAELSRLGHAIERFRQTRSRKAGHDVGFELAKRMFLAEELHDFAEGFHSEYCGQICPSADTCATWQRWHERKQT